MTAESGERAAFFAGFSSAFGGHLIEPEDETFLADLLPPKACGDLAGHLLSIKPEARRLDEQAGTSRSLRDSSLNKSALGSSELSDPFLRGVFAAGAILAWDAVGQPTISLRASAAAFEQSLAVAVRTAAHTDPSGCLYRGVAALDVAGKLLSAFDQALPSHRRIFGEFCTRISHVAHETGPGAEIFVQRVHPQASVPRKERVSDSGYDLTLIYVKKKLGPTTLYGTGIIVEPPHGWYLDVVPRSSIIKRGYLLANNVGVIDRSYRGEIFVPLLKIDAAAPDFELPARIAQLVPRPIAHFSVKESESLSETNRGAGGFGSTGK